MNSHKDRIISTATSVSTVGIVLAILTVLLKNPYLALTTSTVHMWAYFVYRKLAQTTTGEDANRKVRWSSYACLTTSIVFIAAFGVYSS